MLSLKDVTIVYETLLSSQGMNNNMKIDLHFPRKNILQLGNALLQIREY